MKKLLTTITFIFLMNGCDNIAQEVTVKSQHDVDTSVIKLENILKEKGLTHFATIDHKANATSVGLSLNDEKLVIFGNPKVGTLLMQCNASIGLDLPLHMLFTANDAGETTIHYFNPLSWKYKYNITDEKCLTILDKIQKNLHKLAQTIAQ